MLRKRNIEALMFESFGIRLAITDQAGQLYNNAEYGVLSFFLARSLQEINDQIAKLKKEEALLAEVTQEDQSTVLKYRGYLEDSISRCEDYEVEILKALFCITIITNTGYKQEQLIERQSKLNELINYCYCVNSQYAFTSCSIDSIEDLLLIFSTPHLLELIPHNKALFENAIIMRYRQEGVAGIATKEWMGRICYEAGRRKALGQLSNFNILKCLKQLQDKSSHSDNDALLTFTTVGIKAFFDGYLIAKPSARQNDVATLKRRDCEELRSFDDSYYRNFFNDLLASLMNEIKEYKKADLTKKAPNRAVSLALIEENILFLARNDLTYAERAANLVAIIKGHILATQVDHQKLSKVSFLSGMGIVKSDLVKAYERTLTILDKNYGWRDDKLTFSFLRTIPPASITYPDNKRDELVEAIAIYLNNDALWVKNRNLRLFSVECLPKGIKEMRVMLNEISNAQILDHEQILIQLKIIAGNALKRHEQDKQSSMPVEFKIEFYQIVLDSDSLQTLKNKLDVACAARLASISSAASAAAAISASSSEDNSVVAAAASKSK